MSDSIWIKCPNCGGKGKIETNFGQFETCPSCNGRGIISSLTGLPPISVVYIEYEPIIDTRGPIAQKEIITTVITY